MANPYPIRCFTSANGQRIYVEFEPGGYTPGILTVGSGNGFTGTRLRGGVRSPFEISGASYTSPWMIELHVPSGEYLEEDSRAVVTFDGSDDIHDEGGNPVLPFAVQAYQRRTPIPAAPVGNRPHRIFSESIDNRIVNNTDWNIWSVIDFNTQTFIRNPGCWLNGIDLSWVGTFGHNLTEQGTPAGNNNQCFAITRRHVIGTNHYQTSGGYFIGPEGQAIVIGMLARQRLRVPSLQPGGPLVDLDVYIGLLAEELPEWVTIPKVLPMDYWRYLYNRGVGMPMVRISRRRKAYVAQIAYDYVPTPSPGVPASLFPARYAGAGRSQTVDARAAMFGNIVGGDSGGVIFALWGNTPVLYCPHGGGHPHIFGAEIQAILDQGTDVNGVAWPSGYQMDALELSGEAPICEPLRCETDSTGRTITIELVHGASGLTHDAGELSTFGEYRLIRYRNEADSALHDLDGGFFDFSDEFVFQYTAGESTDALPAAFIRNSDRLTLTLFDSPPAIYPSSIHTIAIPQVFIQAFANLPIINNVPPQPAPPGDPGPGPGTSGQSWPIVLMDSDEDDMQTIQLGNTTRRIIFSACYLDGVPFGYGDGGALDIVRQGMKVSKNGAGFEAINGAIQSLDTGDYYIEPHADDADELGILLFRIDPFLVANLAPLVFKVMVVNYDPYQPLAGLSTLGAGADSVTFHIERPDETPIADADVWISTDAAGLNVIAGTRQTDSAGNVTFKLDAPEEPRITYYLWMQKDGEESIDGDEFEAIADDEEEE